MGSSILNVGQSALAAAQVGLTTTAHNIANANTPGYSRQVVIQESSGSQDYGFGFVGKGTQVADVQRVYSDLLNERVNQAQSSKNQAQTYLDQISQINNLLSDSSAGLSTSLQSFFDSINKLGSLPDSSAARQTAYSSAQTLASNFQSLNSQMQELASGVNGQIATSVDSINVYAQQIAKLNDSIEKAVGGDGKAPNDLLDQRDYAVSQLSQQVKATVVKQANSYNVYIGNGQPLVVGTKTTTLVAMNSTEDSSKITVGYVSNNARVELDENGLTGGSLGGLLQFRSQTLNTAQNSLGRIAITLATTFNAQHRLGQDQNGAMGGDVFAVGTPLVRPATSNNTSSAASVSAAITDTSKLTTSDYQLQFIGGNYVVTRLSDNTTLYSNSTFPSGANVIEGVTLSLDSGSFSDGDKFLIRPAANGANMFSLSIKDPAKLAAALPIRTAAVIASNTGSGTISAGKVVDPTDPNLQAPVAIKFTSANNYDIVDNSNPSNPNPPVLTSGTYTDGADISFNGWTVQISGAPQAGDTFTIRSNANGTGDGLNANALASLQTANLLGSGTLTYQSAYAQMVSVVGNKTHELDITNKAEDAYLNQAVSAQQAESGVNIDEEVTNLLRYQQAYQAAGKVMQTANQLFQLLLNLGAN